MRRYLWLMTGLVAVVPATAVVGAAIGGGEAQFDPCRGVSRAHLECAIREDWRLQSAARLKGEGVLFDAGCGLTDNFYWRPWNVLQGAYRLRGVEIQSFAEDRAEVRVQLAGPDAKVIAYRDSWSFGQGGWRSDDCGWVEGEPRARELGLSGTELDPSATR